MQEWIQGQPSKRFYSEQLFSTWRTLLLCQAKDKLRLCMDYRGLNKNTVKDRNPISTYFRTSSNLVHWQDLHYIGLARCLQPSSHQGRRRVQDFVYHEVRTV
ncbi:hypothetical protein BASA83_007205 [Batrachochytrium salamandrivorans]|nr:hypothetical protein BASA83_007205 [Batrachochytrium salamandrivorans]